MWGTVMHNMTNIRLLFVSVRHNRAKGKGDTAEYSYLTVEMNQRLCVHLGCGGFAMISDDDDV